MNSFVRLPYEIEFGIYDKLDFKGLMSLSHVNRENHIKIYSYLENLGVSVRNFFIKKLVNPQPTIVMELFNSIDNIKLARIIYFLNDYKNFDLKSVTIKTDSIKFTKIKIAYIYFNKSYFHVKIGIENEEWKVSNYNHRLDGPAFTINNDGKIEKEEWFVRGVKHRINGPAEITYNIRGEAIEETWFVEGLKHNFEKPSIKIHFYIINYKKERWYTRDILDRKDGPAEIEWKNGVKNKERWYSMGKLHRIDGPAYIIFYDNSMAAHQEIWYRDNKPYRGGGKPNKITRNVEGTIIKEEYGREY